NDARVGEQTGKPATALINRTLSDARRSKFGVLMLGSPANPNACARHWSASTTRMFGLRSAARAGFDSTAKIRNRMRTSLHEPYSQVIGNEQNNRDRFMASIHVRILEVFPIHEPPLSRPSATLSPPCGERAGRGVPIWFMAPMRAQILEVPPIHEPNPLI